MLFFKKFEWCENEILYIGNAGTVQAYGSLTNTGFFRTDKGSYACNIHNVDKY